MKTIYPDTQNTLRASIKLDGRKTQKAPKYFGRNSVGVGVFTQSFKETQKLGQKLAQNLIPGQIICLSGDLGTGKTTFVQGILKGLKVKGPYTSPTFLIMKHYKKEIPISKSQPCLPAGRFPNKSKNSTLPTGRQESKILNIYHIDAYRVYDKDILNLGWEEIISHPDNLIVVEWAERIKKIIPKNAQWINFSWEGKEKRKIIFK